MVMMDTKISTIEILPPEVFHKILNNLNTSMIFFSFYNVCRRFNGFLTSYDGYEMDLNLILKSNFDIFYNLIHPGNITSLILSDADQTPGQISLFISLTNMQKLHRLRSLTLIQVEECHLIIFLQHVSPHKLRSLTIKWRRGARYRGSATEILILLSSIICQPNLRYLNLDLWIYEIKNLSWPLHCTLRYLRIDHCSFSEYCLILRYSPYLKTFVLDNCLMYDIDYTFSSPSFIRPSYRQLVSLSLENIRNIQMNRLESFLSVTPSLEHLKLIGQGSLTDNVFNGSRWKSFIEENLYSLEKFQFFLTTQRNCHRSIVDIYSVTNSFSDSFWTKMKRWYVRCDFINSFSQIRLYSIPICQSCFEYVSESDISSHSTLETMHNDLETINGVRIVNINLSTWINKQTICFQLLNYVFHQVTELELQLDDQWPIDSLQLLSTVVDLSHLVKISLNISFDNDFVQCTINNLKCLFEQALNVHTLHNHNHTATKEIICSIVPYHVKHLQTKINSINDMKMILERLKHLSSVAFHFPIRSPNYPTKIIKWLKQRRTTFTFWCNSFCIHLWLDNNISRLKDMWCNRLN